MSKHTLSSRASTTSPPCRGQKSPLFLALAAALLATPLSAQAKPRPVAIVPLHFSAELSPRAEEIFSQRLAIGLKADNIEVLTTKTAAKHASPDGRCESDCRRTISAEHHAQYIVGGKVDAAFDNYELALWLADGYTGKTLAEVNQRCDVCGIEAAADTMDLAASALRAKLADLATKPAKITVTSDPAGATIMVDGDPVGTTPRELDLTPGKHELIARAKGHIDAKREVTAVGGVSETVALTLIPAQKDPNRWKTITGWTAIGVGIAAVAAGAALLAIDGQETGCGGDVFADRCREERDTAVPGGVVLGIGVAAAVGGGALLLLRSDERPNKAAVAVTPTTTGIAVYGSF